jgi:heptosyltransferase III
MSRDPIILILRGGALGDFLLTLPALQALRARWPGAHVELIGYPHIARLALPGGWVQRLHALDRAGVAQLFSRRPRIEPPLSTLIADSDFVLTYLHDPDGLVRENLLGCGARQVLAQSPVDPPEHAADHLLRPLEALTIFDAGRIPALEPDPACAAEGRAWIERHAPGPRPLAIHPGSGSPRKNWPVERFLETARRARAEGWSPFALLGEADEALAPAVRTFGPELPVCEGLDLPGVAGRLAGAAAYLGNDSGISHLAAALGVPSLCLFGPTDPDRWAPRGRRVRCVRAPDGDWSALDPDLVLRGLAALTAG